MKEKKEKSKQTERKCQTDVTPMNKWNKWCKKKVTEERHESQAVMICVTFMTAVKITSWFFVWCNICDYCFRNFYF